MLVLAKIHVAQDQVEPLEVEIACRHGQEMLGEGSAASSTSAATLQTAS